MLAVRMLLKIENYIGAKAQKNFQNKKSVLLGSGPLNQKWGAVIFMKGDL